ncbi:MAG: FtsQ-type POTRA domain-containing protein [Betaproteobacteria bacterium]|jgi:cell division protein FtsQ|nr:FtsQ-type POTRA domain-containing protein [Betaproteobacteria bacterium]
MNKPLPVDIRLMQRTAQVLWAVLAVMALASTAIFVSRHTVFAIRGITVTGDVTHNNSLTLRANVAPHLRGTFFTLDLAQARVAFEAVPWVRQAVVRREFPNRLRVQLEEHRAVAYWGPEGESRMVNSFGEVFEANVGEVEHDDLPRLQGPDSQSAQVWEAFQGLQPVFEPVDLLLEQLELSGRGSWRARLDTGAVIELGAGTLPEVRARTQAFLKTLTKVSARYGRKPEALETADLRHQDGYALRMRGVTTVAQDGSKK